MDDFEPERSALQGHASTYDSIDRYAQPASPLAVSLTPAGAGARVVSVVLDFLFLKILTTLAATLLAGVAVLVLVGGANGDQTAKTATYIAWALGAMVSAWYFLSSPPHRRGQTIGQRLAGVGPRAQDGSPAPSRAVARHHFVVFFVPSLLLDPVAVIGLRDLAVLAAWCLLQFAYNREGRTLFEDAAGISVVGGLP